MLLRTISGLRITVSNNLRSCAFAKLRAGLRIEVREDGFSSETVLVEAGGAQYYVFRRDLQGSIGAQDL